MSEKTTTDFIAEAIIGDMGPQQIADRALDRLNRSVCAQDVDSASAFSLVYALALHVGRLQKALGTVTERD